MKSTFTPCMLATVVGLILILNFLPSSAFAQGTAFTYQGRLNDGANPANGIYDLRFALYDAAGSGTLQGGALTNAATPVTNGLFTVTLDFGSQFPGANRWLELAVRTNGGSAFSPLTPRQAVTATPYAMQAANATYAFAAQHLSGVLIGDVTGGEISTVVSGLRGYPLAGTAPAANQFLRFDGTHWVPAAIYLPSDVFGMLPRSALPLDLLTNNASGVNLSGAFAGDGSMLSNVVSSTTLATTVATGIGITNAFITNSVFAGNGGGLTNLSTANLIGSLNPAQLPAGVVTNGQTGVNISGTFSGNGAGVTNLSLSSLNSGTIFSWPGKFAIASSPDVGGLPDLVVTADVNGDGKTDLITVSQLSDTLTILTNNGSGGFVLSSSPITGSGPLSVAAADVNDDGKVDLISANYFASTLTVLTNNGSGGFVLSSSPVTGSHPRSVVVADVNGDGKVDLISANEIANTLTVLTNNGSGGFVLYSSPATGLSPYSVVAADVNSDGKVDLISANNYDNTLTVLTNNGSSGFVAASSPPAGFTPLSVVAADVNGDGKVDLITVNYIANTLTVLTNSGSGRFGLFSSPATGSYPRAVEAADVNGDGAVDLISANYQGGTLTVLINDGSGGFVPSSSPATGVAPLSVVAADVNGDGKVDLISANNGHTLTVLLSIPTVVGSFSGDGSGLTGLNLNAANFTGTLSPSAMPDLDAGKITSGTLATDRLPATLVTNGQSGLMLAGSFSGNGAGVTNVNAVTLNGVSSAGFWKTNGNTGANPTNGAFLGTADNLPLEFKVNTNRALRLEYAYDTGYSSPAPNLIGGSAANVVSNGFAGCFIGGGGNVAYPNRAGGFYASVLGGTGNTASGWLSTAMGFNTTASGNYSTAMGVLTSASGSTATAMGSHTSATGEISTALGDSTTASGYGSTAMGQYSRASGDSSTAIGVNTTASGLFSTALGIGTMASGYCSTAMGNSTMASGGTSIAMGYSTVASGVFSFAGGYYSQAANQGSFVWADATSSTPFVSTADNQFLIRAFGGVGINTNNPNGAALAVNGTATINGTNIVNGLVGIGTASPSKPLVVQIRSTNEPAIMVGGAFPHGPRIQTYGLDADANAWMGLGSDMGGGPYEHSLYFPVGSGNGKLTVGSFDGTTYSTKLTVNANGNVGVNTNNPQAPLHVAGNIRWGKASTLDINQGGTIELGDSTQAAGTARPFIDFHYGVGSAQDYNTRLVNEADQQLTLYRSGSPTAMAVFNTSGLTVNGTFVSASDRNLKENFQPVDAQEVLSKVAALPLSRWNYKEDKLQQHVGPMAQDFYSAFSVGPDDKHITTIDESGVALAAIQGLNQKLEEQKAENSAKSAEIKELKQQLAELKQLVQALADKK